VEQALRVPVAYLALGRKIALAIAVVAFIPYALIYGVFHSSYQDSVGGQGAKSMTAAVEALHRGLDGYLGERQNDLLYLGLHFSSQELARPDGLDAALAALRQGHGGFLGLSLVDGQGRALATAGEGALQAEADLAARALDKGRAYGDIFRHQQGGLRFLLAVACPGRPGWVLVALLEGGGLTRLVEGFHSGGGGEALLLNRRGEALGRGDGHVLPLPTQDPPRPATTGRVEVDRTLSAQGRPLAAASRWVGDVGDWLLLYLQEDDQNQAALLQARDLAVGVGAFGGVFVIIVTVFFTRYLVRRLSRADSDKAKLNELIIQSGKLASLGELAEGVAHQINNPLAIMLEEAGWLGDLMREETGLLDNSRHRTEYSRSLNQIVKQGARCKQITTKLLGFAHHTHATPQPTQVNELVTELAEVIARPALYANVNLRLKLQPVLPLVAMSPSEVQQIIINLVNNSLDAMEKTGGELSLRTRLADPGTVEITVADSGPGIGREALPRIFDPFFTTKPKGKGTGLGLAICHSLVTRLGGGIRVESEPGHGAAFIVSLPVEPEPPAAR
jgi:two-component system NtrC family sensor kinase